MGNSYPSSSKAVSPNTLPRAGELPGERRAPPQRPFTPVSGPTHVGYDLLQDVPGFQTGSGLMIVSKLVVSWPLN